MDWLAKYWWTLVLILLVDVLLNVTRDPKRADRKKSLANRPELPLHHGFNDRRDDDDDWPNKNRLEK